METPESIKLPSGATLLLVVAPFADSKDLYQAMLREVKGMKLDPKEEIDANFFKDLFCAGLSSKEIEACLWKCISRCLIDNTKITPDTFEPIDKRDDYLTVCFEIAKANVMPFTKSLYAQYSHILELLKTQKGPA